MHIGFWLPCTRILTRILTQMESLRAVEQANDVLHTELGEAQKEVILGNSVIGVVLAMVLGVVLGVGAVSGIGVWAHMSS